MRTRMSRAVALARDPVELRDNFLIIPILSLVLISMLDCTRLAHGQDDSENSTPTAWWIYSGQSYNEVINTVQSKNARIVNISPDNSSASTFTVTYVSESGAYAKRWWWYVGIEASAVAANLLANKARLTSLHAYDPGGGNVRFAVSMIENTGADAKAWWWYYGQTPNQITNLVNTNNARLTALQSYVENGQTRYAAIMIANKGPDAKGWWWYYNVDPRAIDTYINTNKARLINFTPAANGTFNVVMESCSGSCPSWWWYYGLDAYGVLYKAQNNGARVLTAERYAGCGSSSCFATVMIADSPDDIKACDVKGCISEAKLQANICGALSKYSVGYSCQVGGLRPAFGGQARTAADPPATPMAPDLVTNVASVSKTMTAIGIIQLLTKNKLSIDSKIAPYLYSDWKEGPNINQLTFKELLTHTSGLGQVSTCGGDVTYSRLETLIASGVMQSNIGKPQYGNCNFALLRELMPALLGQPLTGYPDGSLRAQQSASLYINYMNVNVFQPVSVPTSACKPPTGTNRILSYPVPAASSAGTDWGDWTLSCGGGGWVLSGDQIFRVISDLATGNTLLTKLEKQKMFSNCLGWDCSVRSDCPGPYVCKNGDLYSGNTSVWTYAGVLGCKVPVVVVVNSPLPAPYQGGEDIIGLVKDAYRNAAVPGTPKPCP